MNKWVAFIGLGVVILCAVICCCLVIGTGLYFYTTGGRQANVPSEPPLQITEVPGIPATETPATTTGLVCTNDMAAVMLAAQGDVYSPNAIASWSDPDSFNLVTYSVEGDQISAPQYDSVSSNLKTIQQDASTQQDAWELFAHLIPLENRWMVGEYLVFTDGESNILAAVEQTSYDPGLWIMEVDAADLQNQDALIFTLVHEYGHLLTLNPSQVPPDSDIFNDPENMDLYQSKIDACPTYFPGEGCSLSDSYINEFYNRFWTDIVDEWQPIDDLSTGDDLETYYDQLYTFYEDHQDQFVDDYATTDPSEDIAESFGYFVFSPKPTGDSIAEQKIRFFYDYPELVQLRSEILQSLCEIDPQQ